MSDARRNRLPTMRRGDFEVRRCRGQNGTRERRGFKKRARGQRAGEEGGKKARAARETDTTEGREEEEGMFSVLAETDSNSAIGTHAACDVATFVCKGIDDGVGAHSEWRLPFEMHD